MERGCREFRLLTEVFKKWAMDTLIGITIARTLQTMYSLVESIANRQNLESWH